MKTSRACSIAYARAAVRIGTDTVAAAALALALACAPGSAHAQGTSADSAAGAALFNEARALMAQGKIADACSKFDAARKLVTSAGAIFNLADCYEKAGRTASAYGAWQEATILARRLHDAERVAEGSRRAEALEPKLSKLLIDVPPESRVTKLTIQQNGVPVLEAVWGSALPIDPGAHTIDASSPGKKTWTTVARIEAKPGVTTISIPKLEDAPELGPAAGAGPQFWSGQRIAGAAVGGVGVAGLIVGAIFGGLTLSKASASKASCAPDLSWCYPEGYALQRDARTTANVSNALLAIGGAAAVTGLVLFLSAPSTPKETAAKGLVVGTRMGAHGAGLTIEGAW